MYHKGWPGLPDPTDVLATLQGIDVPLAVVLLGLPAGMILSDAIMRALGPFGTFVGLVTLGAAVPICLTTTGSPSARVLGALQGVGAALGTLGVLHDEQRHESAGRATKGRRWTWRHQHLDIVRPLVDVAGAVVVMVVIKAYTHVDSMLAGMAVTATLMLPTIIRSARRGAEDPTGGGDREPSGAHIGCEAQLGFLVSLAFPAVALLATAIQTGDPLILFVPAVASAVAAAIGLVAMAQLLNWIPLRLHGSEILALVPAVVMLIGATVMVIAPNVAVATIGAATAGLVTGRLIFLPWRGPTGNVEHHIRVLAAMTAVPLLLLLAV